MKKMKVHRVRVPEGGDMKWNIYMYYKQNFRLKKKEHKDSSSAFSENKALK